MTDKDNVYRGCICTLVNFEWKTLTDEFLTDVGPKPSPELTIDRIDNDGHYEIGNCKWSTRTEQNNNRRKFKRVSKRV